MDSIAGYLFVTFTGESEEGEQIYFALSKDGFHWRDLNGGKPVLRSDIGEKGVRDPFLLRSRDGDRYYLIATDLRIASGKGWEAAVEQGSRCVIVWESSDLIHWSEARSCEVGPERAGCVWAPEAVYSPQRDAYMMFWASYMDGKHRMYRAYTTDFRSFTSAELYMERPYDVIDMTMIRHGETFYRFYKNEQDQYICMDCGEDLDGAFQPIPSEQLARLKGVEGPAAFPLKEGKWCLLVDQFATNGGYLPVVCENLSEGSFRLMKKDDYDMGALCKRHGSVLALSEKEYKALAGRFI